MTSQIKVEGEIQQSQSIEQEVNAVRVACPQCETVVELGEDFTCPICGFHFREGAAEEFEEERERSRNRFRAELAGAEEAE